MATVIIKGDPGPILVESGYRFDKSRGWISVYVYEGTKASMESLLANNAALFDTADLTSDGATARVQFTSGGAEEVTGSAIEPVFDTWELLGNDIETSIYRHPNTRRLNHAELAFIRNAVQVATDDGEAEVNFATADMRLLFTHGLAGFDSFLVAQYVLRRRTSVPSRYTGKAAFTNTFRVLSSAQLKAAESIPADILFSIDSIDANLPTLPTGADWQFPAGGWTSPSGITWSAGAPIFSYGWLKRTPTVTRSGPKYELTYEYWQAAWSGYLYDPAT